MPKICWAGWTGGEMEEVARGILVIDRDPLMYILGSGTTRDEMAYFMGHGRRINYFVSFDKFFYDLEQYKVDILIHNTYIFAHGCRPSVYNNDSKNRCITEQPQWKTVKAVKILHDGESFHQLEVYKQLCVRFDAVITYNPDLKEFCDREKIPCHLSFVTTPSNLCDPGYTRDIDISFTGTGLNNSYRRVLAQTLKTLPFDTFCSDGAFEGLQIEDYIKLLNRSKMYLATYSAPGGNLHPMHCKNKDGKALLCGALPITEEFAPADDYLLPSVERVVFRNLNQLRDIVEFYAGNEPARVEIVRAGQKKIRSQFTSEHLFIKAFKAFGVI